MNKGAAIVREAAAAYHLGIKDLPSAVRPRERLQALGPQALSDEELIAIILRTGTTSSNVLEISRSLLVRQQGLGGLNRASLGELAPDAWNRAGQGDRLEGGLRAREEAHHAGS